MKLLLLLLFFISCTKYSEIKTISEQDGNQKDFLIFHDAGIANAQEITWRVGPLGRDNLSKGVKFHIMLPKFDEKQFENIATQNNVDSWLVQIRKMASEKTGIIGAGTISFYSNSGVIGGRDRFFRQPNKVAMNVFYKVAAFSPSYANLKCPASKQHRFKITELKEFENSERVPPIEIKEQGNSYSKNPPDILSGVMVIDGGVALRGRYIIELALYNSKARRRMSAFVPLINGLHVAQEITKDIPACDDFKPPAGAPSSSKELYENFKFK